MEKIKKDISKGTLEVQGGPEASVTWEHLG